MDDLVRRLAAGLAIAALVLAVWWLNAFDWLQLDVMNLGTRAQGGSALSERRGGGH